MEPNKTGTETPPEKREIYIVTSTLFHGELVKGKKVEREYLPDEEVELTEAQAKPLLGMAIKPKKAAAKPAA